MPDKRAFFKNISFEIGAISQNTTQKPISGCKNRFLQPESTFLPQNWLINNYFAFHLKHQKTPLISVKKS